MKNVLLLFALIIGTAFSFSQATRGKAERNVVKVKDTTTRRANINFDKKGNSVVFKAETPPLIQIAGAPKANYTYFWEYGDGSYSKTAEPKKVYKKPGEYKVNLTVTNNYDNGKPPKTRPKIVAVNEISESNFDAMAQLPDSTSIHLFANREPMPEEEMVVVLSYQNLWDYVANGKLYLFYNDKEFKNDNFKLVEMRTHFGERELSQNGVAFVANENNSYASYASADDNQAFSIPFYSKEDDLELTITESQSLFRDVKILEFDNMDSKETRNVFFTFKTTPEMIKDTIEITKTTKRKPWRWKL
jgi:hypothetical protein